MTLFERALDRFIEEPANFSLIAAVMTAILGVIVVTAINTAIESFSLSRKLRKAPGADAAQSERAPR